jgi:hypothetical protein
MEEQGSCSNSISPQAVMLEIFKHMKDKDIQIQSLHQDGKNWEAQGLVEKFNSRVKIVFKFVFET